MEATELVCTGDRIGSTVRVGAAAALGRRRARTSQALAAALPPQAACATSHWFAASLRTQLAAPAPPVQPLAQDEHTPGPGTHTRGGYIYATVVGARAESEAGGGGLPVLSVVSRTSQPVVPEPGAIVTAKVSQARGAYVQRTRKWQRRQGVANTPLNPSSAWAAPCHNASDANSPCAPAPRPPPRLLR